MDIRALTPTYAVSPQIDPTDLPAIKDSDPAQGVQLPATAIDVVPMEESRKRLVMRAGTVDFHLTIGSSATAKSLAMALTA